MKNIALVECWFGKFPAWYNLYLLTCQRNPETDWFVFHDQVAPINHPNNVKFYSLKKEELEEKATNLLGKKISIKSGYKVCDLRPAYGKIFENFLNDYKFWGYADSDVFFGKISNFIDDGMLDNYDVIASCRCSTTGQFTIFRNTGIFKSIYQIIPNFINSFDTDELLSVDEKLLNQALIDYKKQKIRVFRRQLQVHDIGSAEWESWAKRLEAEEKGNFENWFWESGDVEWKEGKLIHIATNKEAMFFHFMYWKKIWEIPNFPYWHETIKHFTVCENNVEIVFERKEFLLKLYFYIRYKAPSYLYHLYKNGIKNFKKIKKSFKAFFNHIFQ